MLLDIGLHLLMAPAVDAVADVKPVGMCKVFNHLIRTETLVAFLTVHQRIAESPEMSTCHPCLRVHQDCTIYTNVVWRFLYELLPPCSFNIIL